MQPTTHAPEVHTYLDPDAANRWLASYRRPLIGQIAQVDAIGVVNPNLAVVRGVTIDPHHTANIPGLHYIEVTDLSGQRQILYPGQVARGWEHEQDFVAAYAENLRTQRESAGAELKQARRSNLSKPSVASRHAIQAAETRIHVLDQLITEHEARPAT
jgi:hypothetical protein